MNEQQQQIQQPNISLDKTTEISCNECNNNVFIEGVMLRKASRFVTMTSQDALVPISVFACSKCGHVNDEFLPMQLRGNKKENEVEIKSNN